MESGGNYRAVGPQTRTGDRALGKYQVMASNVGPWTEEVLGRRLTPREFMLDPQAQDAVFNAKFGGYAQKYGPEGAARAWFAGEGGMNDPNRRDALGTSVAQYAAGFNRRAGIDQSDLPPVTQPQQQVTANFFDKFDGKPATGNVFDQFDNQSAGADFSNRFTAMADAQQVPDELRSGLQSKAAELTTGPAQPPMARAATEAANILPAATQGTSPNLDAYKGRLISADTYANDAGDVLYRDPATGQVVPTDTKTQVAIRDPADGRVKIFSRSEETNEGPAVGVSRVLAPGLAAGAATARPAIAAASKIIPKASDIFATAKPFYRAFKNEAGKIAVPPQVASAIGDSIRAKLTEANLIPELAGPVYAAVGILDKGEPITLDALQNIKRVIGRGFSSPDKNVRDAASVASAQINRVIGMASREAATNLKTADQIHSTARSVQDLQRKKSIAGLRAGRAGYGGNAVNSMRQVLAPIVQKSIEGRITGFKPDEIQAMRDIVEGTTATNVMRGIGQMSPSKGALSTLTGIGVGGGAGLVAAGPVGVSAAAILPVAGMTANKVAAIMTGKQIERLRELVAKRSPAYKQAVEKAVERYERAQIEFVNQPTPSRFGALVSASRALSSGFQRDGIQISSGDLLKQIAGQQPATADTDQPSVGGGGR